MKKNSTPEATMPETRVGPGKSTLRFIRDYARACMPLPTSAAMGHFATFIAN